MSQDPWTPIVQFVTGPSLDAEVLLDLMDDDPWYVGEGFSMGAPTFVPSPGGQPGDYGTRTLTVPLRIRGDGVTARNGLVELARQIMQPQSWLRFQHSALDEPIWFRTFAPEPQPLDWAEVYKASDTASLWTLTLELPADPYMWGPRHDIVDDVLIFNDPAAATRGCYLDISGIRGDAPTPAVVFGPSAAFGELKAPWYATEPLTDAELAVPPAYAQAEDAQSFGNSTTLHGHSAAMSGAGENSVEVNIHTAPASAMLRRFGPLPINAAMRPGHYRIYARVFAPNDLVTDVRFRVGVGSHVTNVRWGDYVTFSSSNAVSLDCGVVAIGPAGLGGYGFSGSPKGFFPRLFVDLGVPDPPDWVAEPSTPDLEVLFDYFWPLPVDWCSGRVATAAPDLPADTTTVIDGINRRAYLVSTDSPFDDDATVVSAATPPIPRGDWPMLHPGHTRFHFVRPAGALDTSQRLSVSYHPRWLYGDRAA